MKWNSLTKLANSFVLMLPGFISGGHGGKSPLRACSLMHYWRSLSFTSDQGWLLGRKQYFETLRAEPAFSNLFLLGFLILCCFIIFMSPRWSAARMYRNHPSTDGVVNVSITLEHVDVRLGNGVISCYTWPFYKYWREGRSSSLLG